MHGRNVAIDQKPGRPTPSLYTSKIIKAGAILADTKMLFSNWDVSESVQENIDRLLRTNVFGKASRSRVEDILAIFRQRYLAEEWVTQALVVLVKGQFPASSLDRILYFHSARADRLLFDFVIGVLLAQQNRGISDINAADIQRTVTKWVSEGRTNGAWSESTTLRVTQGLLSALRDFGILRGAVNKSITPIYLSIETFAYITFYLKQKQSSGAKLVELPDWKLFFLTSEGVESFLIEAQQHHLLEYHAAGSVTRLTFEARTLEEYANVLIERAHRTPRT